MIKLKPLLSNISYSTLQTLITGLPATSYVSSSQQNPSWEFTLTAPANLNLNPAAFPSNVLSLFYAYCDYKTEYGAGTRTTATVTVTNNTPFTIHLRASVLGTIVAVEPGTTGTHTDVAWVYGSQDEPETSEARVRVYFGNPDNAVQTYSVQSALTF